MELTRYTKHNIDKGIRDTIIELNRKNWITIACCEGHIKDNSWEGYVAFSKDYNFKKSPPCIKKGKIYYKKGTTERQRLKWLKDLERWANKLPQNNDCNDKLYVLLGKNKKGSLVTLYSGNKKVDYEKIIKQKSKYGYSDFVEKEL